MPTLKMNSLVWLSLKSWTSNTTSYVFPFRCLSALSKKARKGYIITHSPKDTSTIPEPLSKVLGDLSINLSTVVNTCDYPRNIGDVLVLPGYLKNDGSAIADLCVVGVHGAESCAKYQQVFDDSEVSLVTRNSLQSAIASLKKLGCTDIYIDSQSGLTSTAEIGTSSNFHYDKHRGKKNKEVDSGNGDGSQTTNIHDLYGSDASKEWLYGVCLGEAQNLARKLKEHPANLCTPSIFCEKACELLKLHKNVKVEVHTKEWIVSQGMGGLLSVAKGSSEEPRFLVARYGALDSTDVCLVGKGVTFDSGGISIKPSAGMAAMRADMGGAAVTLATFDACCKLGLPLNLALVIPLCENMPDAGAVKPGDVIEMRAGLTVKVDNTDAEGRLILADALDFAVTDLKPKTIIDVATLTGAIMIALGDQYSGLFNNLAAAKLQLPQLLVESGRERGDFVHRMPLSAHHHTQMLDKAGLADLCNVGSAGRGAGSSTAAAFLSHFVPPTVPWMHVDMAGVMQTGGESGSMTGRPARALVHFLTALSKKLPDTPVPSEAADTTFSLTQKLKQHFKV